MKDLSYMGGVSKTTISIFLIWLVHLSGLIGTLAGAGGWFLPKTPLNLILTTALLIWVFPVDTRRKAGLMAGIFVMGMAVEWVGVHTGYLFGTYAYGGNLGPRLDGIPYLIGANWAILSFASGNASQTWDLPVWARILIGAFIMVGLDYFIEGVAPIADFWAFEGGHPPLWNYICWFGLALLFQWAYQRSGIEGNRAFSLHLLCAVLVFFTGLNLYYGAFP